MSFTTPEIFWLRLEAALCLCGEFTERNTGHRDTEDAEDAQRKPSVYLVKKKA
jgi:hypothetical protein